MISITCFSVSAAGAPDEADLQHREEASWAAQRHATTDPACHLRHPQVRRRFRLHSLGHTHKGSATFIYAYISLILAVTHLLVAYAGPPAAAACWRSSRATSSPSRSRAGSTTSSVTPCWTGTWSSCTDRQALAFCRRHAFAPVEYHHFHSIWLGLDGIDCSLWLQEREMRKPEYKWADNIDRVRLPAHSLLTLYPTLNHTVNMHTPPPRPLPALSDTDVNQTADPLCPRPSFSGRPSTCRPSRTRACVPSASGSPSSAARHLHGR